MSDVLATSLLREQILRPDQVDDFLQLQVVMGGAFDTHLLEAKVMSEAALLKALAEAYRMPPIGRDEIDDIPKKMPDIFPRVFAETYRMIPYRLIGRNLGVLVAERPDETAVMKLEQRLKIRIMPAITSEPRVYYAMQRLYGAEIPPRFAALLAQLDTRPAPKPVPEPVSAEPVFQRERPSLIPDRPEAMDLDTALVRMQLGRDRDQIIDVALQFANNAFKFAGLFVLHGNGFVGYSGKGDETAAARMQRVNIPLSLPSMFKTVHETRGHYLGVVPQAGMNAAILDDLGRPLPKIVFLAPVVIRGKITGLLYCDNGKRGTSSRKVADLLVVITRLGPAFERLITRKKAEVKVAANVVSDAAKKAATLKALTSAELIEPVMEAVAPALPEREGRSKEEGMKSFEFQPDEPTIAITFSDGHTVTPLLATELLSQRFLNVLKAAEDDDEDEERQEEEAIDVSTITADALLGKDDAPRPPAEPPPTPTLPPLAVDAPAAEAPRFKAFAEFDDESEEETAKGWEDVLVDTIAQGKQGGTVAEHRPAPAEALAWEDILVKPEPEAAREPAARLDDLSVLLEGMDSPDEDVARRATESLWQRKEELGETFAQVLGARFPGRLRIDPFATSSLPPVMELSPVLRLLVGLGPQALDIVMPHLESQYPAHRLIATAFFGQVVNGHAFSKLLRRLFDDEPRVREVAADTLRRYARLPGYDAGLQRIRERLVTQATEAQARACEILGRLRDVKAVPLLIPLTANQKPEIGNSALGALMRITAEDRGHDPSGWTEWWVRHSGAPREQWLVEGLRREQALLRLIADEELRLLTGLHFAFDASADRAAQEPAVRAWEAWWSHELKHRAKA